MAPVFVLGLVVALLAPLVARFRRAHLALAAGAFLILVLAVVGLMHVDPRIGQGALAENRREYGLMIAVEVPVLGLALASIKGSRWPFWLGWSIHAAFAVFVGIVVVWLEFFWHW
jgi:hypothetical protein